MPKTAVGTFTLRGDNLVAKKRKRSVCPVWRRALGLTVPRRGYENVYEIRLVGTKKIEYKFKLGQRVRCTFLGGEYTIRKLLPNGNYEIGYGAEATEAQLRAVT